MTSNSAAVSFGGFKGLLGITFAGFVDSELKIADVDILV